MAFPCGTGTSHPKAGLDAQVVITGGSIEAGLILFGLPEVAAVLALAVGTIAVNLPDFCANSPPADPGLTASDLADIVNFTDVASSLPAIEKAKQWFLSRYWYQACECVSGGTPAPPALSNPGPLGTNTGLPNQQNTPCLEKSYTYTWPVLTGGTSVVDITGQLLTATGTSVTRNGNVGSIATPVTAWPVDNSISQFTVNSKTLQKDPVHSIGGGGNIVFQTWDSGGTRLDSTTFTQVDSTAWEHTELVVRGLTGSWTSTATHYAVTAGMSFATGNTLAERASLDITGQCSGGGLTAGCCPPDPSITSKLDQLYELVKSLYVGAPSPLTSFAEGAVHAGLTGAGQVSFASTTISLKVQLTTIPTSYGRNPGNPDYFYNVGFINFITVEGSYSSQRLTYETEVFTIPPLGFVCGYDLSPGVVATFTELSRGP